MGTRGRPNLVPEEFLGCAQLVANGLTYQQAAKQMCISPDAFEMRMFRLRKKYNALSTHHLIAILLREGLIK